MLFLLKLYICFSSLFVAVSNHVLPKDVQSCTWDGIQLRNGASLQDEDSSSSASSIESDLLNHGAEQGKAGGTLCILSNHCKFLLGFLVVG